MRAFLIVWAGQLVSLLGTAMTQFALTIWAYQLTKSVFSFSEFEGGNSRSSQIKLVIRAPNPWNSRRGVLDLW